MDTEAFIRKLELQYFDTLEDAKSTDWAYIPSQVLSHRVACVPRKQIIKEGKETKVKVSKEKHLRVKTVWKNGEVSWVAEDSLRKQNPWVLLNYIRQYSLQNHPSFSWSKQYLKNKSVITNLTKSLTFSTKSQTGPKFKFGVQIPMNTSHALYLDKIENNNLWEEAMQKEIDSINEFETFRVLGDDEVLPEDYTRIPYHLIWDIKFDGRRKCRLVAGGHRTPSVAPEEVYSGVVSMETIRMAFVLASMNNLEVCAADISTAFHYGKTREKVYVIAGQ